MPKPPGAEGGSMEYTSVFEELNVAKKIVYSKWLRKTIAAHKNEEQFPAEFMEIVELVGNDWSVSRTVPLANREAFMQYLWEKRGDIVGGTYDWSRSTFVSARSDGVNIHAYSYESKICFLINPQAYKLIFDSRNREAMQKEKDAGHIPADCKIDEENWQNTVNVYYAQNHADVSDRTDDEVFFAIDFAMWFKKGLE